MRFHLEAYSGSIATGVSPLIQINAVPSNIYPKTGQGFLVQQLNQILMASMQGAGAVRGQLQSCIAAPESVHRHRAIQSRHPV